MVPSSVADFPVEPSTESDEVFYGMDKRPAEWSSLKGKLIFSLLSLDILLFAFISVHSSSHQHQNLGYCIIQSPNEICQLLQVAR